MYRKTVAALGALCVDVGALAASSVTESVEIGANVTCISAEWLLRGAEATRQAAYKATDRIADYRVSRKDRLRAWAAQAGKAEPTWPVACTMALVTAGVGGSPSASARS